MVIEPQVPWRTDDPDYPDYLQKDFVAYVFQFLGSFTSEDIEELTGYYRGFWQMEQNGNTRTRSRLELIRTLNAIKKRKIGHQKAVLQSEINKLDLLRKFGSTYLKGA